MSRKGSTGSGRTQECAGWPVEWTCAAAVVLVFAAVSQVGRFVPSFFAGQCTSLSGMCTPARCSCTPPLRRRELVTHDAQACFQCVAEFCPAVSEGDLTCTTANCECDDPTWPRVNIQVSAQPCWQCIRPAIDFTARIDPAGDACVALAVAEGATAGPRQQLALVQNRSECLAFRFYGERIARKHQNNTCLGWNAFGEYWGLMACDPDDPLMQFKQLEVPEVGGVDVYCSGKDSAEFCIEVAEMLCTEEEGRCSSEKCRCEDPSWVLQELQTFNGSHCYTCSPPPTPCETLQDVCTPGACECANPSHVKVLATLEMGKDAGQQLPCYRCQPPRGRNSEASMLATFVLFVIAGLAGGCFVRRLRDSAAAPNLPYRAKLKRQLMAQAADEPRSWSERWAEELEDTLEGLYEIFVDNPMMLVRWVRPHLKQAGRVANNALDACDMALEPLYVFIDNMQAGVWELLVVQHERLVAAVGWACDRYTDVSQVVTRGLHRAGSSGNAAKGKSGKRWRPPPEEPQETPLDISPPEAEVSINSLRTRETPGGKARGSRTKSESESPKPQAAEPRSLAEILWRGGFPEGPAENLSWDPLGLTGGGDAAPQGGADVPEEWMRRLVGMQQRPPPQAVPQTSPSTASRPTTIQLRAQRKLQQRREALAQQSATTSPHPTLEAEPAAPIDESWIDELEREESKTKSPSKKASKSSRKKQALATKDCQESFQYQEETTVKTPPMAELAEPACQKEQAELECAGMEAKTQHFAVEEALLPGEDRPLLFDPEQILGEIVHGLFLLANTPGTSTLESQAQPAEPTREFSAKQRRRQAKAAAAALAATAAMSPAGDQRREEEAIAERADCGRSGAEEAKVEAEVIGEVDDEVEPDAEEEEEEEVEDEAEEEAEDEAKVEVEAEDPGPEGLAAAAVQAPVIVTPTRGAAPNISASAAKVRSTPGPPRGSLPVRAGVRLPSAAQQRAAAAAAAAAAGGTSPGGSATPSAKKPTDTGQPRVWASIVADWAKKDRRDAGKDVPEKEAQCEEQVESVAGEGKEPDQRPGSTLGGVEAPEFVPFSMMRVPADDVLRPMKQRQRKSSKHVGHSMRQQLPAGLECGCAVVQGEYEEFGEMITTVMATGIPPKFSQESFMVQLDSWGLIGTYDFLYMPEDKQTHMAAGCVFINFIDPAFVLLFCWIYHECQLQGTVTPAEVQGLEANRAHWEQYCAGSSGVGCAVQPAVMPNPAPSQWSVNTVNAMLSPQFREQFRKTKMCAFHKKNRCEMGTGCPFAHSPSELMPAPDLAKTKLCCSFFRGRCIDARCKFAHGSQELRSVWVPYSPGVWFFGTGEGSSPCYPAQEEGLPAEAGAVVGYPIMEQHLHCFLHGEVPMLGELPPFVQDTSSSGAPVDEERSESSAIFSNGAVAHPRVHRVVDAWGCEHASEHPTARAHAAAVADVWAKHSRSFGDGVALRVRGTFMEAMRLRDSADEEADDVGRSMKRSFSEGDLDAFRAAVEEATL